MKLIDKYKELKNEYQNSLILIKSGLFYTSYLDDANIFNNIFNFKIVNNKIGFPEKTLSKVINKLDNIKVNYLIYADDNNDIQEFKNNKYNEYLSIIKKMEYKKQMKDMLINRIIYLINESEDNYEKIRCFIDEF